MTKEEREKVIDIVVERLIVNNVYGVEWSDLSIDLKTELYIRFYLNNCSDEKLIAELLGVDNDIGVAACADVIEAIVKSVRKYQMCNLSWVGK